ncbi:MAG TPA: HdeD family acid-resistance protein [Actinomycetes bacterium]|jgi:uncharacterized membrane protein HdeD (DUF308 family)|nr:HdeD family acid-resistance protein [Actinomycetes bacterium]
MALDARSDIAEVLAGIGRAWGWVLFFGFVTILLGIVVLVWPDKTIVVVAVLFGIQLILAGIFRFISALAIDDAPGGTRVLLALLGVLSFIVGIYALRHVNVTIVALALVLGIFWIVNGVIELFTAIGHREMPGRGWTIILSLLSIVAGIVVLAYPDISLQALAVVLGIWLVALGIIEIALAFRLRSLGGPPGPLAPA